MKSKKIILWVASGLGLLLFVVSATMLVAGFSRYNNSLKEMIISKDKIKSIYSSSNPFPTKENIEIYNQNDLELQEWFNDILTNLTAQQIEPIQKSPSAFMADLGEKRTDLHKLINKNGVKMPKDFDLGFKKYFLPAAPLPAPVDVARLGQQLHLIERLLTIFVEAQPEEIIDIRREIFEGAELNGSEYEEESTSPRRRGRSSRTEIVAEPGAMQGMQNENTGKIGKNDIFGKMYFEFEIKAKMGSALQILNNLAKDPMFLRVATIKFQKSTNGILPASIIATKAITDGVALKELSRPQRLVSGMGLEEPMDVVIGIEVYRFDTKYNQQVR